MATRHFRARHSPDCFTRLFLPDPPCFSLFSPFFSLFQRDPGFENPPETVCFQMAGQKAPSRAEQDHNRETIRTYQGDNREITGAEQVGRNSTGSSGMRLADSAPIQPLEMWRLKPAKRRYALAGQPAPIAEAPAPHRLRQLSAATSLMPAGRTLSVEKKKTAPECGSGEPGTKTETRPSLIVSV